MSEIKSQTSQGTQSEHFAGVLLFQVCHVHDEPSIMAVFCVYQEEWREGRLRKHRSVRIPGGTSEELQDGHENPLETLKREATEELNLVLPSNPITSVLHAEFLSRAEGGSYQDADMHAKYFFGIEMTSNWMSRQFRKDTIVESGVREYRGYVIETTFPPEWMEVSEAVAGWVRPPGHNGSAFKVPLPHRRALLKLVMSLVAKHPELQEKYGPVIAANNDLLR